MNNLGSGSEAHAKDIGTQTVLQPLTIGNFRALVGIHDPPRNATQKPLPSRLPWFLRRRQRDPLDGKHATSLYYTLVREERRQWKVYYLYDVLVYSCLVLQLIIASTLIILGALAGDHHIAVAVLGTVTGIITGVLSLVKGQGQPNRLLHYANSLRQVKERIEFMERELIASVRVVTYQDVRNLWVAYETARDEEVTNRPDTWTSLAKPTNSKAMDTEAGTPGTNLHNAAEMGKQVISEGQAHEEIG